VDEFCWEDFKWWNKHYDFITAVHSLIIKKTRFYLLSLAPLQATVV